MQTEQMTSATEFFSKGSGIVTLCGSTKFFTEYMEAARLLTFNGWIVLTCGSFGHSYHKGQDLFKTKEQFEAVKTLHFIKIQMSHAIVVVHDTNERYIGNSTKAEMKFADYLQIPTFYFNGVEFLGTTKQPIINNLESARYKFDTYAINHNLGFE